MTDEAAESRGRPVRRTGGPEPAVAGRRTDADATGPTGDRRPDRPTERPPRCRRPGHRRAGRSRKPDRAAAAAGRTAGAAPPPAAAGAAAGRAVAAAG